MKEAVPWSNRNASSDFLIFGELAKVHQVQRQALGHIRIRLTELLGQRSRIRLKPDRPIYHRLLVL